MGLQLTTDGDMHTIARHSEVLLLAKYSESAKNANEQQFTKLLKASTAHICKMFYENEATINIGIPETRQTMFLMIGISELRLQKWVETQKPQ